MTFQGVPAGFYEAVGGDEFFYQLVHRFYREWRPTRC